MTGSVWAPRVYRWHCRLRKRLGRPRPAQAGREGPQKKATASAPRRLVWPGAIRGRYGVGIADIGSHRWGQGPRHRSARHRVATGHGRGQGMGIRIGFFFLFFCRASRRFEPAGRIESMITRRGLDARPNFGEGLRHVVGQQAAGPAQSLDVSTDWPSRGRGSDGAQKPERGFPQAPPEAS